MDAKGKPLGHTEAVSTKGMKTEDAIKRILGRPNTPITVKVEHEGVAQPFTVEIKRNQVNVDPSSGRGAMPTTRGTSCSIRRRRSATSA